MNEHVDKRFQEILTGIYSGTADEFAPTDTALVTLDPNALEAVEASGIAIYEVIEALKSRLTPDGNNELEMTQRELAGLGLMLMGSLMALKNARSLIVDYQDRLQKIERGEQ